MKKKLYLTESELIDYVKSVIKEIREKYPELLNPLLEKIGEVGYEGLSIIEKKMIDDISRDVLNIDEVMMMINKKIASKEELTDLEKMFFEMNAAVPDEEIDMGTVGDMNIEFEYGGTVEDPENLEIVHKGKIIVQKEEDDTLDEEVFEGEIYCDMEGDYQACNFNNEEGVNLFEKYSPIEGYVEEALIHLCNNLKSNLSS